MLVNNPGGCYVRLYNMQSRMMKYSIGILQTNMRMGRRSDGLVGAGSSDAEACGRRMIPTYIFNALRSGGVIRPALIFFKLFIVSSLKGSSSDGSGGGVHTDGN